MVDMRWNNMKVQRQIKETGLGELTTQPKAIEINLDEVKEINPAVSSGEYQNPFMRADPIVTFAKGTEEPKFKLKIDGEQNE